MSFADTLLNQAPVFTGFIAQGGWVLWLVFGTCFLLWLCIIERLWFFRFEYPKLKRNVLQHWQTRRDKNSWLANATRQLLISEVGIQLSHRIKLIQTLIIICPLMGLLGTVTGMINLFDLISVNGNSDVKALSAGIYRAILPTMAGLVVGLSGYYFALRFSQRAEHHLQVLTDNLVLEPEPAPVQSTQTQPAQA